MSRKSVITHNRKSHTGFRLPTDINDLERRNKQRPPTRAISAVAELLVVTVLSEIATTRMKTLSGHTLRLFNVVQTIPMKQSVL